MANWLVVRNAQNRNRASNLRVIIQRRNRDQIIHRSGQLLQLYLPLWVAGTLPFLLFGHGRWLFAGMILLIVVWTLAGLATDVWWRRSPVDLPLAALMVMIVVSLFVAPNRPLALESAGYLVAGVAVFATVVTWARSWRRILFAVWVLVGLAVFITLLAPFVTRIGGADGTLTQLQSALKISDLTAQKNVLGGILALLAPIALGAALSQYEVRSLTRTVLLAWAALLVICAGLALSDSRGALAAVALSLAAVASLRLRVVRLLVLVTVTAVAVFAVVQGPQAVALLLARSGVVGDLAIRGEIWSRAVQVLGDYPITGVGLGNFQSVVPVLYPYVLSDPASVHHAHNTLLQIGVDIGLPGVIAFVSIIAIAMGIGFTSHRRLVKGGNDPRAWVVLGLTCSIVAVQLHGLVDAVLWGTKPSFLVWGVLGLLCACSSLTARMNPTPDGATQTTYPLSKLVNFH